MNNNTHYVCPECGGVSDKPGVCKTENCDSKGDPLQKCNCDDGSHDEIMMDNQEEFDDEYDN